VRGNKSGQYNLGVCYEFGLGVTKDEVEAAKLFRQAANQGHIKAEEHLALLLSKIAEIKLRE
jgi:TPR repeat protein